MVKAKEQSEELFFVQVKDPNNARRHILESLKDIVEMLQRFEKFKRARHQKLEKIHKLRGLIKDANKMLGILKLKMPQTNLRAAAKDSSPKPKNARHAKHAKKKPKEAEKPQKKEPTEIDKLEAELNAIESKLKSLT